MKLGIDFGTSFSTMAWLNPDTGRPEIIRDENGIEKIPSVVFWSAVGRHLVGKAAVDQFNDAARMEDSVRLEVVGRTIFSVKRELFPNRTILLPDGTGISPCEVVSETLKYLKRNAEGLCFHAPVSKVVLTHPVAFSKAQCDLLSSAARTAGFESIELVPEPVSAVRGYAASGTRSGDGVLVFDLGGGTLDLAFLKRAGSGVYEAILPPLGNIHCGGDDFDRSLYDFLDGDCQKTMNFGLDDDEGRLNQRALLDVRTTKERLTSSESGRFFYFDTKTSQRYSRTIERKDFAGIVAKVLQAAKSMTETMLKEIDSIGEKIDTLLLIGGSTRMPVISEMLSEMLVPYGVRPEKTMKADVAVALGAVVNGDGTRAGEKEVITLPGGETMELVYCPPGDFAMGSSADQPSMAEDEHLHHVRLSKGFWIGRYPVTRAQWVAVMGDRHPSGDCGVAIGGLSWNECNDFLMRVGLGLRLPTEAEWEYAARAGSQEAYFPYDAAKHDNRPFSMHHFSSAVTVYEANGWGICGMYGEVSEWCSDWYDSDYYKTCPETDPQGPCVGDFRVLRGAGKTFLGNGSRFAYRACDTPDHGGERYGFRVCRTA